MKKALSLMLCALLLLSTASGALASQLTNEESGITITIPDGFSFEDVSEGDVTALLITDDAEPDLAYVYEVVYNEDLDGLWLEDLTEEQLQSVAESLAENVGALAYETTEADGIYYLIIQNEEGPFAAVLSLLNGWSCALYATVSEGKEITDLVWEDLGMLQAGITYGE